MAFLNITLHIQSSFKLQLDIQTDMQPLHFIEFYWIHFNTKWLISWVSIQFGLLVFSSDDIQYSTLLLNIDIVHYCPVLQFTGSYGTVPAGDIKNYRRLLELNYICMYTPYFLAGKKRSNTDIRPKTAFMYRLDPSPIKYHTGVTSPGFLTALLWDII